MFLTFRLLFSYANDLSQRHLVKRTIRQANVLLNFGTKLPDLGKRQVFLRQIVSLRNNSSNSEINRSLVADKAFLAKAKG